MASPNPGGREDEQMDCSPYRRLLRLCRGARLYPGQEGDAAPGVARGEEGEEGRGACGAQDRARREKSRAESQARGQESRAGRERRREEVTPRIAGITSSPASEPRARPGSPASAAASASFSRGCCAADLWASELSSKPILARPTGCREIPDRVSATSRRVSLPKSCCVSRLARSRGTVNL